MDSERMQFIYDRAKSIDTLAEKLLDVRPQDEQQENLARDIRMHANLLLGYTRGTALHYGITIDPRNNNGEATNEQPF